MSERKEQNETGVVLREREEKKVKRPRMYRVILHNDDYTPMDFVVRLLETVFHHDPQQAARIMLHVHTRGVGVAGTYPWEVAETKAEKAMSLARDSDFPLLCTVEPE